MGKIKIYNSGDDLEMKLPGELVYFLKNNKVVDGRQYYRVSVTKKHKIDQTTGVDNFQFVLTISNYWSDYNWDNAKYNKGQRTSFKKSFLTFKNTFSIPWSLLMKTYTKSNGRISATDSYEVDYSILEKDDRFTIICYFNIGEIVNLPSPNADGFSNVVTDVFSGRLYSSDISHALHNHLDEFYHFIKFTTDSFVYVTKDKFHDVLLNNGYNRKNIDLDEENSMNIFGNHARTMSLSKFMIRVFPKHDPKVLQQYIEYNKMLSNYDPSMFSIVTGSDISKYYAVNSYFTTTGDLGTSCMRHDDKQAVVQFYDKNSNISLIVAKPPGSDSIIGRALLWTTTDGTKIMDRIYTSNSKLVSLFHKYAAENGFLNIYEVRKHRGKKDFTAMSPANWLTDYDRNYIVDLQYIPDNLAKASLATKFVQAFTTRAVTITNSLHLPYIDNFNLINAGTKQASLLPIENTFGCTVSETLIDINNYLIIGNSVYNGDLVTNNNGVPTLNTDVVELDSPTLVPKEEEEDEDYDDFDLDDDDYTDEELELETIVAVTQDLVDISNVYANPNLDDNIVTNMVRTSDARRYYNNTTPQAILDYFNIIREQNQDTQNV
jgi:hypothetical protein